MPDIIPSHNKVSLVDLIITVSIEDEEKLAREAIGEERIHKQIESVLWDVVDPDEVGFEVLAVEEVDGSNEPEA